MRVQQVVFSAAGTTLTMREAQKGYEGSDDEDGAENVILEGE